MDYFEYREGELFCEDVAVSKIVKHTNTPVYIYSYRTLERHFRVFNDAFKAIPHLVCYSCKACSNIAILKAMGRFGGGADIVSQGELYRALKASIPTDKIVFSGVGKTEDEIKSAISAKILMINIESEAELLVVANLARRMKTHVPVSIRVNPQIDPKTHPYITTGLKKNKFGIVWEDALRLYSEMGKMEYVIPVGIASHIGSQILELAPFIEAVRSLKEMVKRLSDIGIQIRYLDLGGGLGITYNDELPPHPDDYARVIEKELRDIGLTIILEPGRVLVGNSGILVTKLLYVKVSPGKTFYIVDSAMNDLIRPTLYQAYHQILPVKRGGNGKVGYVKVDVVGPVCESGDFFAKDREMPFLKQGDLLAIKGSGAYGFSMSSNYNSRRRVPEVMVRGEEFFIIKKRESLKDLVRGESIPKFLEAD